MTSHSEGIYEVPIPHKPRESLGSDDFVDINDLDAWNKTRNRHYGRSSHGVKIKVTVERSITTRPPAKPNFSILKDENTIGRSSSFTIASKSESIPNHSGFESSRSRWSTDSGSSGVEVAVESEPWVQSRIDPLKSSPVVKIQSSIIDSPHYQSARNTPTTRHIGSTREKIKSVREKVSIETKIRKSYSLHDTRREGVRMSRELDKNRRHSLEDGKVVRQSMSLRDSTLDLVSDDENNDVYAAVSLAGTLRNRKPISNSASSRKNRRRLLTVGGAFIVFIIVIIVLVSLLLIRR